jgi:hypothetical protein
MNNLVVTPVENTAITADQDIPVIDLNETRIAPLMATSRSINHWETADSFSDSNLTKITTSRSEPKSKSDRTSAPLKSSYTPRRINRTIKLGPVQIRAISKLRNN